eukprot:gene2865-4708_t
MKSSLNFLSIGCNRVSGCSDWSKENNLFAYAGHRSVVFYDVEKNKVILSLNGHEKRVNTLKWINKNEISSGGSDKKIIIWSREEENKEWKQKQILKGHEGSVTSLSSYSNYLVSTSSDKKIIIWSREQEGSEWKLFQKIVNKKMMECSSITKYKDNILIASGGCDHLLHFFLKKSKDEEFQKLCSIQGHQDWIRCLSFKEEKDDELLLSTGCQDNKIRIYKVTMNEEKTEHEVFKNENIFIYFNALLIGHEEWVHTVEWNPTKENEYSLLSSSMDRTMMIWEPSNEENGIWINKKRFGEFGGLSGLFGQLGYFGARFSKDGKYIIGHGYNGSFHLWDLNQNKPKVSISGHFSNVVDISWDPKYNYFLSTSLDQTTRLFSKYNNGDHLWYEISRPQIHGYDLLCLDFIKEQEHKFISGGNDEKVFRVFEAPITFLNLIKNISNIDSNKNIKRSLKGTYSQLGLSNKGINQEEEEKNIDNSSNNDEAIKELDLQKLEIIKKNEKNENIKSELNSIEELPFEEDLLQNTLWPETQKLYGHSNEIMTITSSNKSNLISSSCKSKNKEYSKIIIWSSKDWKIKQELKGYHNLTITRIQFSNDDQFMISISRDRKIVLYKKQDDGLFKFYKQVEEAHERIIWDCSFSKNGKYFVTGSRDQKMKIWETETLNLKKEILFKNSITSISFLPSQKLNLISIGFENGNISFFNFNENDEKNIEIFHSIQKNLLPCETITRMKWRINNDKFETTQNENEEKYFNLLVSSNDHSIRLYDIELNE